MAEITSADVQSVLNPTTNLPEPMKTDGGGIITQEDVDLAKASPPGSSRLQIRPYDSMNFTNIYRDDISKYTKYDVPTTRFFNWDEKRAQNQGTGEKWING